ncbi:MAG: hypothetical protein IPM60_10150 [Rhodospirillales bacterium]|nr:hypothetical protein [Rhodospirillales bacterium]
MGRFLYAVVLGALLFAFEFPYSTAVAAPWMGNLVVRDAAVWPGGRAGNYGTVKYFVDEDAGDSIPVQVTVEVYNDGQPPAGLEVQLFTNLNRRQFAKPFETPGAAGLSDSYWMTVPMAYAGPSGNNHLYRANLDVMRTGAYRITARFRDGGGPWLWLNDFDLDGAKQRDCAVVVSPKKVLGLTLYEVNTLVVEAFPGGGSGQRSTLEDFTDHDADGHDPFNLAHIRNTLGFHGVWLMPVFPITNLRYDPGVGHDVANNAPGSPYSTRNYYAVNGLFDDTGDEAAALNEFEYLVDRAETLGLDVFIDVAFNHSGRDTVFGQGAVDLGLVPPADVNTEIRLRRPAWATNNADYRDHAHDLFQWAVFAPKDRLGEHQWYDAGLDWYFGNYSSLGPKPGFGDTSQGGALDERDLYYTDLDPVGGHDSEVKAVWDYFANVLPYWLERTDNKLDGIRADFAQGLPPRAWEYIINKTRQKKWDFVFLAEVLDPDQVRYRANRHFDIVTTVDHYLYRNNDVTMGQLQGSLEGETGLYGYNAAVLHNGTSHDEDGNGNVWLMAARYAVAAASYGVPMVYMGQPLGVPYKVDFQNSWQDIKSFWDNANPAAFTMYRRINAARDASPALRSTNRWFLTRQAGGGFNEAIFSTARWVDDQVVLVFVNLRDAVIPPETFAIPGAVPLDAGSGVRYQAFNLLADDPDAPLWPTPRSAADIYANGIFVGFNFANESQYLQLRKVP